MNALVAGVPRSVTAVSRFTTATSARRRIGAIGARTLEGEAARRSRIGLSKWMSPPNASVTGFPLPSRPRAGACGRRPSPAGDRVLRLSGRRRLDRRATLAAPSDDDAEDQRRERAQRDDGYEPPAACVSPAPQAAAHVDLLLRERARGHEAGCATVTGRESQARDSRCGLRRPRHRLSSGWTSSSRSSQRSSSHRWDSRARSATSGVLETRATAQHLVVAPRKAPLGQGAPHASQGAHREHLTQVRGRERRRLCDGAEHDVPPLRHGVRREAAHARQDDLGRRAPLAARLPEAPRHRARGACRGRVLDGRPVRLRVQLLDVRRRLRSRGQRQLHAVRPATTRASSTGSTCAACGSIAPTRWVRSPKVVAVTPDDRYVLVSNWCTWDLSVISTKLGPRGAAHPDRGVSAGYRRLAERERGLRRRDGRQRARPRRPAAMDDSIAGRRRRAARRRVPSLGQVRLRLAERRGPGGQARSTDRHRAGEDRHGQRTAQPGPGRGRPVALRRQLRERHGDEAAHVRHEAAADDRGLLPPDRDHLRPRDTRVWVACYTGSIRVYNDW